MSTQPTPHDWRTRASQYEPEAFDIVPPGLGAIALVKNEKFACLIAAAPDLLEALQLCEGNIDSLLASCHPKVFGEWLTVVRAAIAKATGAAT